MKLNNKLAALLSDIGAADTQPTAAQRAVYEDIASQVNAQLAKLKQVVDTGIPALNRLARDQNVPAITEPRP